MDCPDHAVYVDVASSIDRSTTGSQVGALCMFEDDLSETAWRHTNTGGEFHLDLHPITDYAVLPVAADGPAQCLSGMYARQMQ